MICRCAALCHPDAAASARISIDRENQPNIGLICRLLGGVPLRIELTAQLYVEQGSSVLEQLIEEIEQLDLLDTPGSTDLIGLDHLQTAAIDLPERQRSIRVVFDHSWQLLTNAEQDLLCHCAIFLCHCAIFHGGFSREAICLA